MIDKTYQPSDVEGRIYADLGGGAARSAPAGPSARDAEPYCIVIPPPNVTGSLHMGHALNNTLQDMLVPLRAHARHATCCGSPAPTMPASPPRWWSSAS